MFLQQEIQILKCQRQFREDTGALFINSSLQFCRLTLESSAQRQVLVIIAQLRQQIFDFFNLSPGPPNQGQSTVIANLSCQCCLKEKTFKLPALFMTSGVKT